MLRRVHLEARAGAERAADDPAAQGAAVPRRLPAPHPSDRHPRRHSRRRHPLIWTTPWSTSVDGPRASPGVVADDLREVKPAASERVQRPVVGVTVGSPGALVGHVGKLGPALDPGRVAQPEHQVRVGARVGGRDVRPLSVIEADATKRVSPCATTHTSCSPKAGASSAGDETRRVLWTTPGSPAEDRHTLACAGRRGSTRLAAPQTRSSSKGACCTGLRARP
jgi:hypothetical protein